MRHRMQVYTASPRRVWVFSDSDYPGGAAKDGMAVLGTALCSEVIIAIANCQLYLNRVVGALGPRLMR